MAKVKLLCECGSPLTVRNTWTLKTTPMALVSRSRVCGKCGVRFTTYEIKKDTFLELVANKAMLKDIGEMLRHLIDP